MSILIKPINDTELYEIKHLLDNSGLETADLKNNNIKLFTYTDNDKLHGVIGLEAYAPIGLVRSFAVKKEFQGQRIGFKLLDFLLDDCAKAGFEKLYLLTTTAEKYFRRNGFKVISRDLAPEEIKSTSEFSELCPVSAVLMEKVLMM
ncbi:GNAT family N-acetyltransferase [bacterium]|nr:GNAT family N-acetyltransferase [bacterium]